jgi:hypothetical protein
MLSGLSIVSEGASPPPLTILGRDEPEGGEFILLHINEHLNFWCGSTLSSTNSLAFLTFSLFGGS